LAMLIVYYISSTSIDERRRDEEIYYTHLPMWGVKINYLSFVSGKDSNETKCC